MRLFARSLGSLALVLVPLVASAQGAAPPPATTAAPPAASPPPSGGGDTYAPASKADSPPKSTGSVEGVSFNDKVLRGEPVSRVVTRHAGPLATFPGFESLADGGSRLFVHLSQSVSVEERRAAGTVTYVLRGAHLRVRNDSNALVTVHFNTPVVRARLTPQGNDLLFILEMRSAASPTFTMQDNQDKTATLQIELPKGEFLAGDGSESLPQAAPARTNAALGRAPTGKRRAPAAPPPASPSTDPGPTP